MCVHKQAQSVVSIHFGFNQDKSGSYCFLPHVTHILARHLLGTSSSPQSVPGMLPHAVVLYTRLEVRRTFVSNMYVVKTHISLQPSKVFLLSKPTHINFRLVTKPFISFYSVSLYLNIGLGYRWLSAVLLAIESKLLPNQSFFILFSCAYTSLVTLITLLYAILFFCLPCQNTSFLIPQAR